MIEFNELSVFFDSFIEKKNVLLENFYFDLHMHTTASDGDMDAKFMANFLDNKDYLVSITDHNEISGALELKSKGFNIVPGIELGCSDGFEILVYFKNFDDLEKFYNEEVKDYKNKRRMAKTLRTIDEYLDILRGNYNVHISIPHISGYAQKNYLKNKSYIFDVLKKVDSLEIYNHSLSRKKNIIAKELRKRYNLSATFGSDAHSKRDIISYSKYLNKEEIRFSKFIDKIYKIKSIGGIGQKHILHFVNLKKTRA
ncbi:MAG: PHP domain-containing protein [Cetobacterium sp.]|uniref:PHP domain-containing protein n=1 Tax=unclassified Cetobacterium TaxID=2630983 RepID=UPI00163C4E1F|nr:PHP domain-containing protein [Cetobacterium sp. 2A]MBC2855653.1 PHP domain-containing protein [Cetobacterium sp. 2A]